MEQPTHPPIRHGGHHDTFGLAATQKLTGKLLPGIVMANQSMRGFD